MIKQQLQEELEFLVKSPDLIPEKSVLIESLQKLLRDLALSEKQIDDSFKIAQSQEEMLEARNHRESEGFKQYVRLPHQVLEILE